MRRRHRASYHLPGERTQTFPRYRGMNRILLALAAATLAAICVVGCGNTASGSQRRAHTSVRARSAASAQGTNELQSLTINAGGLVRNYLLYVPSADSSKHPLPLVLVYHGAGDTAQNTTSETGLLSYDEQHGSMILAFLQGVQETWNDDTGDPAAEAENVDDIGFTKAVLN